MSRKTVEVPTETSAMEVQTAAHAFAQSLADSAAFQAFEQAAAQMSQDDVAQKAIQAFQKKQQSLQMMLRLNAVSPADRAELERLQSAFMARPSVIAYLKAQEELTLLFQAAGNLLSERLGLSFSAACGPGCC